MSKKVEKTVPLLRVDWIDALSQNDAWRSTDKMPGEGDRIEVSSVGWLLRTTKEYLVLVPTLTSRGGGCSAIAIPKKCVLEKYKLVGKRQPRPSGKAGTVTRRAVRKALRRN